MVEQLHKQLQEATARFMSGVQRFRSELQLAPARVATFVQDLQKGVQQAADTWNRFYASYAEVRYSETGNPLFAWNVYRHKRRLGEPIPDWVLSYFDRAALNLAKLQETPGRIKDPISKFATALEMKKPNRSGRRNMFADDSIPWLDLLLAGKVLKEIEKGSQETYAIESVAAANAVSQTKVRRAWKWWQEFEPALTKAVSESRRLSET